MRRRLRSGAASGAADVLDGRGDVGVRVRTLWVHGPMVGEPQSGRRREQRLHLRVRHPQRSAQGRWANPGAFQSRLPGARGGPRVCRPPRGVHRRDWDGEDRAGHTGYE